MELKEKLQLSKSKSTSMKYKIFVVCFFFFMLFFLISKLYLPEVNNLVATPLGTEKKLDASTILMLNSWQYNKSTGLMEVIITVQSTGNNYHKQFTSSAVSSGKNGNLQSEIVFNSDEVLVIDIQDVNPKFDGVKLTITLQSDSTSTSKNEAEFICTSESVEYNTELEAKTDTEFEEIYLKHEIENCQAKIDELYTKMEGLNEHISELQVDIQALEKKLDYQTEDEKKETYAAIESKNIEINKTNNEICKIQLEIENYQSKIKKYSEKLQ